MSGAPLPPTATPEEVLKRLQQSLIVPLEIPESWLTKISDSSRSQLPEMPDSWLREIKEAARPDLLSIVLGSSVLAALIALASAALTAHITNVGAEQLEKEKLVLQGKNERRLAYRDLSQNLDSLATALDAYLRMSRIGARSPREAGVILALQDQRNAVGLAERKVLAAEKDTALRSSPLIQSQEIDKCIGQLSPMLSVREDPPADVSQLGAVLDRLRQLVSEASDEMSRVMV